MGKIEVRGLWNSGYKPAVKECNTLRWELQSHVDKMAVLKKRIANLKEHNPEKNKQIHILESRFADLKEEFKDIVELNRKDFEICCNRVIL